MIESIKPVFDFIGENKQTVLWEGSAEVYAKTVVFKTITSKVELSFYPTPRISIYAEINKSKESVEKIPDLESITSLSLDGRQVEGFCTNLIHHMQTPTHSIRWTPKITPILALGHDASRMEKIIFHLFDFMAFISLTRGGMEQRGAELRRIDSIKFNNDEWVVEIQSIFDTSEQMKLSKETGGAHFTHIACVKKLDGGSFTGADATWVLKILHGFLSFAKGEACPLVCPTGIDETGNITWQQWSYPRTPHAATLSWFPIHAAENLSALFPYYSKLWMRNQWSDALHEVIYWYLNANNYSRGTDAGIILTQAALERLSFEFAVQDKRLILTKGFTDLWASDKFRLLFSSLNIPLEIPIECSELCKMAKQNNWADAPHALTEVRNSLVHPEHKKRGQFREVMYETWNLGLWYLEMSILAVCGYSGTYANRLKRGWKGQTEPVPWARP